MIIFTKQGNRIQLPYLTAFDGGVWCFAFSGEGSYTDPADGTIWTWDTKNVDEVIGVNQSGQKLFVTESISDCEALEGSFYWDDANMNLYVHWFDSVGDWGVDRDTTVYAEIVAGYANGYSQVTKNVFDGVYYEPIILNISGMSQSVDLLQLGLISFEDSSITLTNENGRFDYQQLSEIIGVPLWVYLLEDDDITLSEDKRIFTGSLNGSENNRETIKYNIIESRLFDNKPICKNTINLDDFPNAGDQEGELMPVAFGDVRRGIVVPLNLDALTDAGGETAQLLLADPNVTSLIAEGGGYTVELYDEKDNDISAQITSFDETTCILEFTTVAGVSPGDYKDYKWSGRGYDIDGDYNNGLDIMRASFLYFANIPYLQSTFNQIEWGTAQNDNPQPVGISIQSDKGFVEELIEPITTSLQGIVEIQGNGKITYNDRDLTEIPVAVVFQRTQLEEPTIGVTRENTVSELVVEYAPDFTSDEALQYVHTDDHDRVVSNYGIDTREPISPLQTILTVIDDVIALAEKVMDIYSYPEDIREVETTAFLNIRLFDIIGVDTGKFNEHVYEYIEITSIDPDYNNFNQKIIGRIIPGYIAPTLIYGTPYGTYPSISVYGFDVYGTTRYV